MYTDYEGQLHFIAIGTDGGEDAGRIRSFAEQNGYTWPMIPADGGVLNGYRISSQSTAVMLDSNGIITSRSGYGSSKNWRSIFDSLLEG